jgi:hypothetical protein
MSDHPNDEPRPGDQPPPPPRPPSPPETARLDEEQLPRAGAGPAARTPQGDHTPRQEEQQRREALQQRQSRPAAAPVANPELEAERREAWAAASIGAQVILDFNEDGSLGARGGAAGTIEGNTLARDAWLGELGLDPITCSGPPRPRVEEEEPARAARPLPDARATRASSLAAGISQGARP